MKFLCLGLFFLGFSHSLSYGAAVDGLDLILGTWRVQTLLDTARIMSSSPVKAHRLIGKKIVITASDLRAINENCINPVYSIREEKTNEFFPSIDGYLMSPVKLHLPEVVTAVDVDCDNSIGISSFYMGGDDRVVFDWNGYFFEALRK